MINLTINDQPVAVKEGRTILEACRENGFTVPTLCYHPALKPFGACRLCIVEISQPPRPSRLAAACTYPCEPGLQVQTDTPQVQKSRRITAELLLASAWDSPEIQALAEQLGVREVRFRMPEENLCVLCGLCLRACQEIVGNNCLNFIYRGIQKKVSPPFQVLSSTCIACGTCTLICPTGAISLNDITGVGNYPAVHGISREGEPAYCQLCGDVDLSVHFDQDLAELPIYPGSRVQTSGG